MQDAVILTLWGFSAFRTCQQHLCFSSTGGKFFWNDNSNRSIDRMTRCVERTQKKAGPIAVSNTACVTMHRPWSWTPFHISTDFLYINMLSPPSAEGLACSHTQLYVEINVPTRCYTTRGTDRKYICSFRKFPAFRNIPHLPTWRQTWRALWDSWASSLYM